MASVAGLRPAAQAGRRQGTAAVLFDFDGTLWDPETLIYQAHTEVFADAGVELGFDLWAASVGRVGVDRWRQLSTMTGEPVDEAALTARLEQRIDVLLSHVGPRPGVAQVLDAVDAMGLPRAIVSNSRPAWVQRYSVQCGVGEGWSTVRCFDGDPRRAKPNPALYLAAMDELSVRPERTLVFEDSPSGVRAAKAAGATCIAVANPITKNLDLDEADLRFDSFEQIELSQVLDELSQLGQGTP